MPIPAGRSATRWSRPLAAAAALALAIPAGASAASPASDPFYQYTGSTPLGDLAPGTILKTRTGQYRVAGIATPLKMVQLAYRTTSQTGKPVLNVTSVIKPPWQFGPAKLLSYQSAYDSLNPADQPSSHFAGGITLGGMFNAAEAALTASWLLKGYTLAVPDTEGQQANFAAGPEYGRNTLDGLRATYASPAVGLPAATKTGLLGYSGGAIATEWAAELAPKYAPDVNAKLIGAAFGGVLVNPARNLHYIDGSTIWAGVMPMAIIGAARSFEIDLKPYLTEYGLKVYEQMKDDSIIQVLGAYSGLTWSKLAKPEYPSPETIPDYVKVVNQLIMGTGGTPTIPLYIGEGNRGDYEGTPNNKPGIGAGDGVMVAGDVRTLARQYCAKGTQLFYREYAASHVGTMVSWLPSAQSWLENRFDGRGIPNNCGQIPAGNPLDPVVAP
ncbi:MAG: triacylglycerol lipase [Solirubrobacteraceae bacterium]|nr:triacylglycerol lipase [Solirubrobacteraceae bacterium]